MRARLGAPAAAIAALALTIPTMPAGATPGSGWYCGHIPPDWTPPDWMRLPAKKRAPEPGSMACHLMMGERRKKADSGNDA